MKIPLRQEHRVLLGAIYKSPLKADELPIKGMVAALLVRRGFAEWIRPFYRRGGRAIALKITAKGRTEYDRIPALMEP